MHLYEPVTAATDLLLAVVLTVFGTRIYCTWRRERQASMLLWGVAFFALAVASVLAGISHGPGRSFEPLLLAVIWKLSLDLVGLGGYLMFAGTVLAALKPPVSRVLIGLGACKFLFYVIWISTHEVGFDDFHVVMINYGISFAGVIILTFYASCTRKVPWARWIAAAIFIAVLAGAVQQSGVVIHRHFNYNDLYHLISLIPVYLAYRGAILMRDRMKERDV